MMKFPDIKELPTSETTLVVPLQATLAEVEKTYIQLVLKRERSITRAAVVLGIGRSKLYRRLNKYRGKV